MYFRSHSKLQFVSVRKIQDDRRSRCHWSHVMFCSLGVRICFEYVRLDPRRLDRGRVNVVVVEGSLESSLLADGDIFYPISERPTAERARP